VAKKETLCWRAMHSFPPAAILKALMKKWSLDTLSLATLMGLLGMLAILAWQDTRQLQSERTVAALLIALLICAAFLKIRMLLIARDAAHALLQASETRYREIIDTSHEGIWLLDTNAAITFANVRLAVMLGCDVGKQLGRPADDFLLRDAGAPTFLCRDPDQHQLRDVRYLDKDGSPAWALVGSQAMQDERGTFMGTLVMLTDITKRKLAEQALSSAHLDLECRIDLRTAELKAANEHLQAEIEVRKGAELALAQSEERLREIVAMMPIALFLKDADSRILLTNEACDKQWGVHFSDIVGTRGSAYFPPQQMEKFLANDRAAFAERQMQVNEELCWNSQQQESRLMQTFKKPIFDANGQPHLLIGMYVDITERKQAEEALQYSYTQLRQLSDHQETIKEEERRRIALDIHDDLGQNLMALKIDASMLHARTGQNHPRLHKQVQRVIDNIDQTIKSVRTIINDLHPSTLELGLGPAIEWLLKQFERRSNVVCKLDVDDDGSSLNKRHTAAIFRIVQESLSNIERHACASTVQVTLTLTAKQLSVVVADNGVGILPADRSKSASFGLKGIQERVDSFGGKFLITNDHGTRLSILIPGSGSGPGSTTGAASRSDQLVVRNDFSLSERDG
jgi:two-component system sensor histidine kinase UhpB